jgi:hypothetical protein
MLAEHALPGIMPTWIAIAMIMDARFLVRPSTFVRTLNAINRAGYAGILAIQKDATRLTSLHCSVPVTHGCANSIEILCSIAAWRRVVQRNLQCFDFV